jgi:hypothetical protein
LIKFAEEAGSEASRKTALDPPAQARDVFPSWSLVAAATMVASPVDAQPVLSSVADALAGGAYPHQSIAMALD